MIWRLVISVLLLGWCLVGLWLLPPEKGVLLIIFGVAVYPLALAATVVREFTSTDVVTMYKEGLKVIPIVGKLFRALFTPKPR